METLNLSVIDILSFSMETTLLAKTHRLYYNHREKRAEDTVVHTYTQGQQAATI